MGIVRVTTRPQYYYALEEEQKNQSPSEPEDYSGMLTVSFQVGGMKEFMLARRMKRIEGVVTQALREKGRFVRDYCGPDDYGYYEWNGLLLRGDEISVKPFHRCEIDKLLPVIQALDAEGWFPENGIDVIHIENSGNLAALFNMVNIIESRQTLIEQALSLTEPLQIIMTHGVALGLSLSAFSYTAVEAAAFLLQQAWRMANSTGKARMKPVDGSNPKFQMRSWLLRLGFIGEEFERPRKTLLEGLAGDTAFFSEDQKKLAVAKRKAMKMNAFSA